MAWKARKSNTPSIEAEIGAVRKDARRRIKIALVYPNHYHVGMSNLGFQTVYALFNHYDEVVCERAFLPDDRQADGRGITSVESHRPLQDFDIIAFSISFENDYLNLLTILDQAGLPLRALDRGTPHPLIIAGGAACFINPEPIAPFMDCVIIGEVEPMLDRFIEIFASTSDHATCLKELVRHVEGIYVPRFYQAAYHPDGALAAFRAVNGAPPTVKRVFLPDLSQTPTCSTILTPDTAFNRTYLIEVSRGCPHGCRFCTAGYIYRPPRFRPTALIQQCLQQGLTRTNRIGLVGAAVSDLPEIRAICREIDPREVRIGFSSLRADALDDELIAALKASGVKTATIAPDAGSERMRNVINKGLDQERILAAAEALVAGGVPNLKLYFMVGLPTETMADVAAMVDLCKKIKHRFLKSSRARKRIGTITISLNSFVPKPATPFQWAAMDEIALLKEKIKIVKGGLKKVGNVRVHSDVPRWAYIQTLLSRGDRRVADILALALKNRGNWPQTLKASPLNADFFVHRLRSPDEILPWDFIDHGISKSYLQREYQRAQAEQSTPPCRPESCRACGICKDD